MKLSAEQRNKWRKSPPFTTIFAYQYNRDSCRECEERPKNHGSASKILCNFFSFALIYNASLTTSSHYPLEYRTFLTILTLFSNLLLLAIMINHDGHPRGIKPCTFGVALQLSTMPKRHTMPSLLKLPTTYCFFNYFPLSFFRFKNARHNA